jgi:hypothetical protein
MPVQILIKAADHGPYLRGYPVTIKDEPCEWGNNEGLPDFVILRVSDATKDQVEHFLGSWQKFFQFAILAENDLGYRVKIEVDPSVISANTTLSDSERNMTLRSDLKVYITSQVGISIVDWSLTHVTVDITKPADLQAMKEDLYGVFAEQFDVRRYYFSSTDVDLAVAGGGSIELTKAQALNRIVDRLA